MATSRLRWTGLEEWKAAMRALPADLRSEGGTIVEAHVSGAFDDIEGAYPERTGNLRRGLRKRAQTSGPFGISFVLENVAPHALLFEDGTKARHTDLGANRGSMPAGNVFRPRVARWKRRMYQRLADLLVRHGFRVSGLS